MNGELLRGAARNVSRNRTLALRFYGVSVWWDHDLWVHLTITGLPSLLLGGGVAAWVIGKYRARN